MKKIIILICFILLLSGCDKQYEDNKISKNTEKTMMENSNIIVSKNNELSIEEVMAEEIKQEEIINNDNKNEPINNEEIISVTDETINNYDNNNKIDCENIDDCMSISLPIQYELKNSIDSVFYLEINDNKNELLGYYIDYSFKDYQYKDYDTCTKKGAYLMDNLADRIDKYECSSEGLLTIIKNKQGDTND